MKPSRCPTSEECATHAAYERTDWGTWHALWSPQFGGYVARCAVFVFDEDKDHPSNSCLEIALWHDGEFPTGPDSAPVELHVCDPDQIVRFGETVKKMMGGES